MSMKPIPKSTTDTWRRMSERGVPLNPAQAIRLLDFLEETIRELAMAEETIEGLRFNVAAAANSCRSEER